MACSGALGGWQGGLVTTRTRAAAIVGMLVAVVLAWLNGVLVRTVTVDVQFFGETADRSDYRVAAGAGLMTAVLLLAAMLALSVFGAPVWLQFLTGAGVGTQLALGITAWWSSRAVDDTFVLRKSGWEGAKDVFLYPGSWLLLVVLALAVLAAVTGRSRPSPR